MKFIIGSASQRKIDVAKSVIDEFFKDAATIVEGYASISGVPETPWDKETFDGAKNRATGAGLHVPGADYYIGLESGLIERYGHIYEEAWAVVVTGDGKEFYGYSSGLKVPDYVLSKMDGLKMPHSEVMTILEKEHNKTANDTWGSYSGGMIVREVSLKEAIRNALIQAVAPEESFYKK